MATQEYITLNCDPCEKIDGRVREATTYLVQTSVGPREVELCPSHIDRKYVTVTEYALNYGIDPAITEHVDLNPVGKKTKKKNKDFTACEFCGADTLRGRRGLINHTRIKHPEEYPDWHANLYASITA